ncbi:hypothetical protein FA95DRAFT_1572039 [Auriscalpium vulgare]|uniref:Uncharacterized protein n=1 Tax=Auriscalpium vulgare TaxID=40419 RepID=A0ACB8RV93_9AGAM|nr:hypothetical protein FA95DRAFT_1572039 [Auriscalpium vulgare]
MQQELRLPGLRDLGLDKVGRNEPSQWPQPPQAYSGALTTLPSQPQSGPQASPHQGWQQPANAPAPLPSGVCLASPAYRRTSLECLKWLRGFVQPAYAQPAVFINYYAPYGQRQVSVPKKLKHQPTNEPVQKRARGRDRKNGSGQGGATGGPPGGLAGTACNMYYDLDHQGIGLRGGYAPGNALYCLPMLRCRHITTAGGGVTAPVAGRGGGS